jgi:hypothetical protein
MTPEQEARDGGVIPPDGSIVTATRFGWREAQANNQLEYPDPAIPLMDLPAQVIGELRHHEVHVKAHGLEWSYTRYTVDGVDVEPGTIRPVDRGASQGGAQSGAGFGGAPPPLIPLDRPEESADWLKIYDPIELGLPPDTLPLAAARMLNLGPDLAVFRQRRTADGTIVRLPRGWWQRPEEGSAQG